MRKILLINLLIFSIMFFLFACTPADVTPPVLRSFTVESSSTEPYVEVTSFTGSDDTGITGYLITTTDETPSSSQAGWSSTKWEYYGFTKTGSQTLYAWAKDAAGNVSNSISAETSYTASTRNWTIMVWLDGDNNLEEYAVEDLNEMEYGLSQALAGDSTVESKLAIVVQIDRTGDYDTSSYDDGPDWTGTRRYFITPDSSEGGNIESIKLAELGEVNMGNANNLKSFINYTKTIAPADKYALILWNHGGGVQGNEPPGEEGDEPDIIDKALCGDDTNNSDSLYVGEITDVLTDAEDVEVIGIDACLMGMVEVAYEYRPASSKFGANYLTASPHSEQGDGWPYDKIINRLKGSGTDDEGDTCYDVASLTEEQLATIFSEEYSDFIVNDSGYYPYYYTDEVMTAMDLSQVESVKTALDALAGELNDEEDDSVGTKSSLYYYGEGSYSSGSTYIEDVYPHYDLYDFADYIDSNSNFDSTAQTAAGNLKTVVNNMVIKSWGGSDYSGFTDGQHGLGFFFPDEDDYGYWRWYTEDDTASIYGSDWLYGNLDFCDYDGGTVNTWKELLDYWF